jgi:hypothetical protein
MLELVALRFRSGRSKDLEIVVLRHELAILRRRLRAPNSPTPIGSFWSAPLACCRAGAGRTSSSRQRR